MRFMFIYCFYCFVISVGAGASVPSHMATSRHCIRQPPPPIYTGPIASQIRGGELGNVAPLPTNNIYAHVHGESITSRFGFPAKRFVPRVSYTHGRERRRHVSLWPREDADS